LWARYPCSPLIVRALNRGDFILLREVHSVRSTFHARSDRGLYGSKGQDPWRIRAGTTFSREARVPFPETLPSFNSQIAYWTHSVSGKHDPIAYWTHSVSGKHDPIAYWTHSVSGKHDPPILSADILSAEMSLHRSCPFDRRNPRSLLA